MDGFHIIAYCLLGLYYLVLALLAWGAWRWWKGRRWVPAAITTAGLVYVTLFPGMSQGILPGSWIYLDLVQTHRLTGRSFLLGKSEMSYRTKREFNGDGYSIDVYSISTSAADRFLNPPPSFFEVPPERPDYRSDWKAVAWRRTPAKESDMDYIHFVSIYPDQPENHKKEPQQVAARLLAHEGSYYAYYYNARTGIGDVDLFIFAPKERRFVIVNQNT